jgi:hypothetical protein
MNNHDETVEMSFWNLLADRPDALSELAVNVRRQICKSAGVRIGVALQDLRGVQRFYLY